MRYLTEETYKKNAIKNMGKRWITWERRWEYFNESVELVKTLNITDEKKVLEAGTMGSSVVVGCDTIDYFKRWNFVGKNPTYVHDMRKIPWPVENKKYDLFVALRVFQHLVPVQKECFLEAKRIAKNVIIVAPIIYKHNKGISREQFIEWNNGISPDFCKSVFDEHTYIYLWKC